MLAIRLQRIGRTKRPIYRVIVSEKSRDTQGRHLELLGNYNPNTKVAVLKKDRIAYWLKVGAQASSTVHNLFIKEGIVTDAKKAKSVSISRVRASNQETAKAKPKETKAEDKTEAKTE